MRNGRGGWTPGGPGGSGGKLEKAWGKIDIIFIALEILPCYYPVG